MILLFDRAPRVSFGVAAATITLAVFVGSIGCSAFYRGTDPKAVDRWIDTTPPTLKLSAKADHYQRRIQEHFQTPEGLIWYRREIAPAPEGSAKPYGNLADGCFYTGIYLASQSLRYAVTRLPEARTEVLKTLGAMEILHNVTGKRGLLARHFGPAGNWSGGSWRPSPALPRYDYRGDVSKDQYSGYIHGLGVAWAVVDDAEIRARVRDLAAALADHIRENELQIVDAGGKPTTFGDLRGRRWLLPVGVNAAIALAIAKVGADAAGGDARLAFYRRLIDDGYARIARRAHIAIFDSGKRVNDHMAYLALYPLLLIEKDLTVLDDLHRAEERSWRFVGEERNAFFAFVHGGGVELQGGRAAAPGTTEGGRRGREALLEYPADKVHWPVDLITLGYDFPRACIGDGGLPTSTVAVPLYLRMRSASLWVSNPYRLAGEVQEGGKFENAGVDYLQGYWMGRYHGFIADVD